MPKGYRDALALETGAPITVLQVGSGLLLLPEDTRVRNLCEQIAATFARHGIAAQDLLYHAAALPPPDAEQVLADYTTLLTLARPQQVPLPTAQEVQQSRTLIRHAADVPVLLSAMQSPPAWVLTHNTGHFTADVAARTGLRIATPCTFFQTLARSLA